MMTIVQKIEDDCVKTKITIKATVNKKIRALIKCWNLNTIGFPDIVPCNFPKARTEPEKVTAPIKVPILISTRLLLKIEPTFPILNDIGS